MKKIAILMMLVALCSTVGCVMISILSANHICILFDCELNEKHIQLTVVEV